MRRNPMKAVLIVFAIVASVAFVVLAVGQSLPVAHTARRAVTLNAAPGDVWAVITNVAAYPAWRSDVDSVEILAPVDGRPTWRERSGGDAITYALTYVERPTRMVTRITDRDLPFGGEWDYELSPHGSGTRIVITERGEVYSPFFRFVSRFILGHTATLDGYLRALGTKFGETLEPAGIPDSGTEAAEVRAGHGITASTAAGRT